MPVDDPREAPQHVVERDEAVGQDDALDRRVRDVALVPQRDVLERRHGVGRAPGAPGRRSARSRSGCACAASPTSPSAPCANGSSTSPISVFCRPRISSANFSSDAAVMASAASSSACRSRWMTCDDTGAGSRPERRADRAPRSPGRGARRCRRRRRSCRRDTASRARRRARCRARPRRTRAPASGRRSSARRARRACGRSSACARARSRAPRDGVGQRLEVRRGCRSQASRICSASAVSTTSDEVRPKCSQRAAGPTLLGHGGREGDHVVLGGLLDLVDAGDVERRPLADARGRPRPG